MQFIKDNSENTLLVTGIDSGAIRVNEEVLSHSLVLTAENIEPWPVTSVSEISSEFWNVVLETSPEIILLGTGTTLVFPEAHQLQAVYDRQIGVEVMDTEAACRTFNLLVHESRRVTAALILQTES